MLDDGGDMVGENLFSAVAITHNNVVMCYPYPYACLYVFYVN